MQKYIKCFNKIRLLNDITNQIIYYGIQCGNEKLMDYVDMNCGGIPEGEFNQVVDVNAPVEFLKMYTNIIENRFAYTVSSLLKMNEKYLPVFEEFLTRTGKEMNLSPVNDINTAFDVISTFVLDENLEENNKKIISKDLDTIVWEKETDIHEDAWKKADCSLDIYYDLQKCFINGLLSSSNIEIQNENNHLFRLIKNRV